MMPVSGPATRSPRPRSFARVAVAALVMACLSLLAVPVAMVAALAPAVSPASSSSAPAALPGPGAMPVAIALAANTTVALVPPGGAKAAFGICTAPAAAEPVYIVSSGAGDTANGEGPYCLDCTNGPRFIVGGQDYARTTAAGGTTIRCRFYDGALGVADVGGGISLGLADSRYFERAESIQLASGECLYTGTDVALCPNATKSAVLVVDGVPQAVWQDADDGAEGTFLLSSVYLDPLAQGRISDGSGYLLGGRAGASPNPADCNDAAEENRLFFSPSTATLFMCGASGWQSLSTAVLAEGGRRIVAPQHVGWADYNWQNGSSWNFLKGVVSVQTFGSLGTYSPTSASYYASRKKLRHLNTVSATGQHWGYLVNLGGFSGPRLGNHGGAYFRQEFGFDSTNAIAQLKGYVFLCDANAGCPNLNNTSTQPSSTLKVLGVGVDSGDANLQVMHNDDSGTCTKIDLGAGFPAQTRGVDWYRLEMLWTANSAVEVTVTNLTSGAVASHTLTANLPGPNVGLGLESRWGNHTSTPGGNGITDFGPLYFEIH